MISVMVDLYKYVIYVVKSVNTVLMAVYLFLRDTWFKSQLGYFLP